MDCRSTPAFILTLHTLTHRYDYESVILHHVCNAPTYLSHLLLCILFLGFTGLLAHLRSVQVTRTATEGIT